MDGFKIPINPKWYIYDYICTPDNGFLYPSNFQVIYISTIKKDEVPKITSIDIKTRIKALACDSDWSNTKYFAILADDNSVYLWDFDKPIKGHNVHTKIDSDGTTGAICFTSNKKILSAVKKQFVIYCILSNKYTLEKDFLVKLNNITILKPSPYNCNIVAAGTKSGLIVIANYVEKNILYLLRAHDLEITSLDWMLIKKDACQKQIETGKKILPAHLSNDHFLDTSEIFDIYSFDELENEFGTIRDTITTLGAEQETGNGSQDVISENEKFNFIEACKSLKDDILGNSNDELNQLDVSIPTTSEIKEKRELNRDKNPSDDESDSSEIQNLSPSLHSDPEKTEDFIVISPIEASDKDDGEVIILASGSKEPIIWLWDTSNGTAVDSIKLNTRKVTTKSAISSTYTVLAWANENTLISNTPSGDIVEWEIKYNNNKKLKIRSIEKNYIPKAVMGLCTSVNKNTPFVWTVSVQRQIVCTKINDRADVIANYHTLCPNIMSIDECPHDMNKIAISGIDKRICILNLSNMKANSNTLLPLMNKIQSKVLSVQWHPYSENILSFSTSEGRIGIFDANKSTNVPIIMKPFCGKPVYSITWGKLTKENKERMVLFACGSGKLFYFPETGDLKYHPIQVEKYDDATSVSAGGNYLAVGTQTGVVYITDLKKNLELLSTNKISNKYISRFCWSTFNKNLLAISSMDGNIYIFNCSTITNNEIIDIKKLSGHLTSVVWVNWSKNTENKLVSTSYDGTVRVWDTNTLTTISVYQFPCIMYCALFSSVDDNIVICAGHDRTIEFYDYRKYNDKVIEMKNLKNMDKTSLKVEWATPENTTKFKSTDNINKTLEENSNNSLSKEISENFETLQINDREKKTKKFDDKNFQKTTLYLTHKEMNKDPLSQIKSIIDDDSDVINKSYIKKLFSKRSDVLELLNEEYENIKKSSSQSPGLILIPQISGKLRDEIIDKTEKKQLTTEHVALSPFIGFAFWKSCCEAYAYQCFDQGIILHAIPYLLACHEVKEAMESLCKTFHYREAWVIGKMHLEEGHPLFKEILTKWIDYLDQCGNYGAAALFNVCINNYQGAILYLNKIKTSDTLTEIVQHLSQKINLNN